MSDLISRQAAIEAAHKSIYDFFDICDDDEESPMTYKDELLLEVNKAITTQIKAVVSAPTIEAKPIERTIRRMIDKNVYNFLCWLANNRCPADVLYSDYDVHDRDRCNYLRTKYDQKKACEICWDCAITELDEGDKRR